jgi:hypothetical protein
VAIETRYLVALADIASLRLSCKACGAAYSIPLTRALQPPNHCRACNAVLFDGTAILEREAFSNFQECVKALLLILDDAPFRIEFELPIQLPPELRS